MKPVRHLFSIKKTTDGKKSNVNTNRLLCNKTNRELITENNSNDNNNNLYEINCSGINYSNCTNSTKGRFRTQFLIKFHPFTFKFRDKRNFFKSLQQQDNNFKSKNRKKMSQRCCLSVSVVPSDKQSSNKNKNKNKLNTSLSNNHNNNSNLIVNKKNEDDDLLDDSPYTKEIDKERLIKDDDKSYTLSNTSLNKTQQSNTLQIMNKSTSKNLNDIITSASSISSTNGIKTEHVSNNQILPEQIIDYVNTIHTPSTTSSSSSCATLNNNILIEQTRRLSIVSNQSNSSILLPMKNYDNKKLAKCSEFNLRINHLRFIDDSATSTALTSPVGSITQLNIVKKSRQPQQQHKLLSSCSSTSSSRTISLTASSTSSGQSTPTQIPTRTKRISSIQRQANVQSSTETLCSDDTSQLQRQHELLTQNYLKEIKHRNSSELDDEEIKDRQRNSFKSFDSEDDNYYSYLYEENKKLLEKCKMEKLMAKQNGKSNDSDSSSACSSLKNFRIKKFDCSVASNQYYSFPSVPRNGYVKQGDERIYAYDNFDCINECLEEIDHFNSGNVDEDEEDETSNLVEDGFIRMSSPVDDCLNNSINNTNVDTGLDTTAELNDLELSSNDYNNVPNFPNVGSSPVSEEFLNTSSDIEPETLIDSNSKTNSDYDGIIIHNSSDSNTNEIASLSDDNGDINDDDFGFEKFDQNQIKYLTSSQQQQQRTPHSIMKTKNSCLKNYEQQLESHSNSDSPDLGVSSGQLSQKPKVRFNLDINYEKEREWNRVNKLIGDASNTQIEWTQEVEV
ncbi:unnamed protein product [Brachionus calyciflorus]|uniref:Uncharacterized protein n=1 Tax=Brachionus calyciflorus TaxID=104777 RepID=A0A814DIJ0_9BILA|nr:unnamed protein product [Brachionus calyciflorus]